jgi:type I restriction enzyme S subunit
MNKTNTPQIRFKGFTEAWEQRKLGDVFNFQYGEGNTNPSDGGDYPVYGAGGQQGSYSRYNAENSIIIGHMGDAGCISWGEGKHFVTYNGTITTSKSCDFPIRFGYYLLLTSDLRKLTGGSSLKFLTYEMIRGIVIHIPQYKVEQIQIGTLFYNLDNLITLHQRELEKLQKLKSACLQKMFV